MPKLDGGWRYDKAAGQIVIDLAQVQTDGARYRLPIEVAVASDGAPAARVERVEVTGLQNRFTLAVDREPASVTLDPRFVVLMDATFAKR